MQMTIFGFRRKFDDLQYFEVGFFFHIPSNQYKLKESLQNFLIELQCKVFKAI